MTTNMISPFHVSWTSAIWTPHFEQCQLHKNPFPQVQVEHHTSAQYANWTYSQLNNCHWNIHILNTKSFENLVDWTSCYWKTHYLNKTPTEHCTIPIEQKSVRTLTNLSNFYWPTVNWTLNICQLNKSKLIIWKFKITVQLTIVQLTFVQLTSVHLTFVQSISQSSIILLCGLDQDMKVQQRV